MRTRQATGACMLLRTIAAYDGCQLSAAIVRQETVNVVHRHAVCHGDVYTCRRTSPVVGWAERS